MPSHACTARRPKAEGLQSRKMTLRSRPLTEPPPCSATGKGPVQRSVYGAQLLSNIVSRCVLVPEIPAHGSGCHLLGRRRRETVVDYFAGCGTTGHAVINLNRQDGGSRRFILVEMGEYFDTVLLPRSRRSHSRQSGRMANRGTQATAEETERGPRIVKYLRLESYEDSLNNIALRCPRARRSSFRRLPAELHAAMGDEGKRDAARTSRSSPARSPTSCRITDGQETSRKTVDIPETFAYLLGLHVKTRRTLATRTAATWSIAAASTTARSPSSGATPTTGKEGLRTGQEIRRGTETRGGGRRGLRQRRQLHPRRQGPGAGVQEPHVWRGFRHAPGNQRHANT